MGCRRKSPIKLKEKLTTNALIAGMRFFGIPTRSLLIANARKFGLMVVRVDGNEGDYTMIKK